MAITFNQGWDSDGNHTSERSEHEVRAVIEEIPTLALSYDFSRGSLGTAIQMSFPITVSKGIHDDSRGKHITIEALSRTWHLYLKRDDFRGGTFLWRVDEIR